MRPSRSAASTIATPMRSLTDPPGLNISSLANSSAPASGARRDSRTIGVRPTCAEMLIGIEAIRPTMLGRAAAGGSADERAEAGLGGLLAGLALDRDGLGGTHEVTRVRGDLLGLAAQLVRAVQDRPLTRPGVHDEARHAFALVEGVEHVGDVLGVF